VSQSNPIPLIGLLPEEDDSAGYPLNSIAVWQLRLKTVAN